MVKLGHYLVLVVITLVFASFVLADFDTYFFCVTNEDCTVYNNGEQYYCNFNTSTCFQTETTSTDNTLTDTTNDTTVDLAAEGDLTSLEEEVIAMETAFLVLQNELATTKVSLNSLSDELSLIKGQLTSMEVDVSNINNQLQQLSSSNTQISSQTNSLATGLAGLQEDIVSTKSSLDQLQVDLEQKQARNRLIVIAILVLIGISAAVGVGYYVTKDKKSPQKISPEIISYITSHIQKGSKFSDIKTNLLKAGWIEEDIDWAYKETVKHNYGKFRQPGLKKKEAEVQPRSAKTIKPNGAKPINDPKKLIYVAVVSILLIGGLLFVLRGASTGKAIELSKLVGGVEGGQSGKVEYTIECTPPHILTPDGDGCCLDEDNNAVCDNLEGRQAGALTGSACTDNKQCPQGEYCINDYCTALSSLYQGTGDCSKQCEIYAIEMTTSDKETYNIKPKGGSYTSAGALEWKTLKMPIHCKGEQPIVPINIIQKKTGEIINERVITLKQGETSKILTHPSIPSVQFSLKANRIYYSCEE
ncbi:MAG: hypothetical protein KJ598_00370 [Nanoarchaeota archaeon]|nr:hypothetical protein [Nanoarchaeota archaeon]MBU1643592.1 hypothetical protein [Nanoarchaeota archaeon]